MKREVIVGGIYKHFKGMFVRAIAIANHTETGETLVIYYHSDETGYCKQEGKKLMFARPLKMFLSEVDKNKYPNAEQKYRLEYFVKR